MRTIDTKGMHSPRRLGRGLPIGEERKHQRMCHSLTISAFPAAVSAVQYGLEGEHMGRIGMAELVVILFIVILVFGASRLPEIGRGIGRGIRNFKDATTKDSDQAD